jgi:hypothetical protein
MREARPELILMDADELYVANGNVPFHHSDNQRPLSSQPLCSMHVHALVRHGALHRPPPPQVATGLETTRPPFRALRDAPSMSPSWSSFRTSTSFPLAPRVSRCSLPRQQLSRLAIHTRGVRTFLNSVTKLVHHRLCIGLSQVVAKRGRR